MLQRLADTVKDLPKALRKKFLADHYDTDDEDGMLCCFPGCNLPKRGLDGTDNPWYWYDSERSLQEAASMEVAHTF